MSHAGKRIRKARESVVRTKLYPLAEAVKMVKSGASAKFDAPFTDAIPVRMMRP